jgi:hypothetical protein
VNSFSIALVYPPGAEPPILKGTLTGPPNDLRVEIRMADLITMLQEAQARGGKVEMKSDGLGASVTTRRAAKEVAPSTTKKTARKLPAVTLEKPSASTGTKPSPTQDAVLEFLKGGDCTRTEIIKQVSKIIGATEHAVYQAFDKLKAKGLIERYDDIANGGLPKWRLVQK